MVMAHGLNSTVMKRGPTSVRGVQKSDAMPTKTGIGSRRIFPPHFKLQVLDSYRNDADCKGNQRATARKYGIHRRQIQKWLQAETNLRSSIVGGPKPLNINNNNNNNTSTNNNNVSISSCDSKGMRIESPVSASDTGACHNNNHEQPRRSAAGDLMALERHRQRDDALSTLQQQQQQQQHPTLASSRLSPVLSPAAGERGTPLDCSMHTRCPSTPAADIVSPTVVVPLMPMDLSVKRPSGASSAPVPSQPARTLASPSQSLAARRSRSRSRSPHRSPTMLLHTHACSQQAIKREPPASPTHDDVAEIWDLSTGANMTPIKSSPPGTPPIRTPTPAAAAAPTKPLFKPYLLDEQKPPAIYHPQTTILNNNNNNINNGSYKYGPSAAAFAYDLSSASSSSFFTYHHMFESIDVGYVYDESGVLQPATYLRSSQLCQHHPLLSQHPQHQQQQQRHSYSLDFKLRAIDSYYQDENCKGNQRAVAFKFNIHRRQVQKWLKQEDELRERNERQLHAVT